MNDEITPEQAADILGLAKPLVIRRMEDGRLPFTREGTHRRCKISDVVKLKAIEEDQNQALQELGGDE